MTTRRGFLTSAASAGTVSLTEAQRASILGGNAARLFNIKEI